uniref:Peptidase S1 domain-containing protein n=1 Tax=Glossina morsitans morsitans TaxID=37546 RepID=A0A1B0G6M3_GLOMM
MLQHKLKSVLAFSGKAFITRIMHFKQTFSIKFVFNVILLAGLIKSSNADTIGALQDCNTDGETRICVPHSLCKRRKSFVHTYDEKCRNNPNGPVVVCCLMSNLLVGVVENGSARNTTEKTLPERMCDEYHIANRTSPDSREGRFLAGRFPFLYALGWMVDDGIQYGNIAALISARYLVIIQLMETSQSVRRVAKQSLHKILVNSFIISIIFCRCPSVARAISVSRYNQRIENIDVIDCVLHPFHQFSIYTHHILLVKLAKHMEPTYNGATCLWTSNYIDDHIDLNLLYNKKNSYELQKLILKDAPTSHCTPYYEETMKTRPLRCATASVYPRDSCPFDISSPIFAIVNNIPFVVGFAELCRPGKPFVYSLISDHISWIEKVIWPDYY